MSDDMSGSSSSSDFSSDEEDDLHSASVPNDSLSSALPVVPVEVLDDDEEEDKEEDATELLEALRSVAVPEPLVLALEPVLLSSDAAVIYRYDAYTTALYHLASLWPDDNAAMERLLHRARRVIYRRFHRAFPLTPEMYSEYISDVDKTPQKLRLYEQAMDDYLSVPLALEYLELLAENKNSSYLKGNKQAAFLQRMERMLTTAGQHYTLGHDVWKLCRELLVASMDGDSESDMATECALRELYARQMKIPLQQNDLVMSEFRAWSQYNTTQDKATRERVLRGAEHEQQKVLAASGVFKKMNHFEERLQLATTTTAVATGEETLEQVWIQYIKYVQYKVTPLLVEDAPPYVVALMERAIASVCLSTTLWRNYLSYLQQQHSAGGSHTAATASGCVYHRAIRNVSFDSSFWVDWLLAMETHATAPPTYEQLSQAVERELLTRTSPPLMDSAHMTRVLTTYCSIIRRISKGDAKVVDSVVATCHQFVGIAFPEPQHAMGITAALWMFYTQFLAFEMAFCGKGKRQLLHAQWLAKWQRIVQLRGDFVETWVLFLEEFKFTHAAACEERLLLDQLRQVVFEPAVAQVKDYPLVILEKWLAMEMATGDRNSYLKVRKLYESTAAQAIQAQAAAAATGALETPNPNHTPVPSKKRKAEESQEPPRAAKKYQKEDAPSPPQDGNPPTNDKFSNANTVFVCNLAKTVSKPDLEALFGHIPSLVDVRLIVKERGSHVKSRGMAYVQFQSEQGVLEGLALDGQQLGGQQVKVERSVPKDPAAVATTTTSTAKGKAAAGKDKATAKPKPTTLYVGGLAPAGLPPITDEQLQSALEQVLGPQSVHQILIQKDKRGKPKDFALVEMKNCELVENAILKIWDLQQKLGNQISIKVSKMTIAQVVKHKGEQKLAAAATSQKKATAPAPSGRGKKPPPVAAAGAAGRPRALMAPRALRKPKIVTTGSAADSITAAGGSATALTPQMAATVLATVPSVGGGKDTTPKTNADFKKLFM